MFRAQALVREWHRSGFLGETQSAQLEISLRVDLKRTNFFLRALLFLFGAIIVFASVWLITETFRIDDTSGQAATYTVMAIVCFVVAEILVARQRLYRFGIEESLLCASAVLLMTVAATLIDSRHGIAGAVAGAVCGFLLFLLFGYVYAAIGGMISAAMLPFFATDLPEETNRLLAAVVFAIVFFAVRPRRLSLNDDFPGDDYGLIQAAAWAGVYCAVNLQFSFSHFSGNVYWFTYAMTWALPVLGLWLSIPKKDRMLMNLNVAMLLTTLMTNKPYLGLERKPWDPILFGVLLIGSALIIKRWLKSERYGFTAERMLIGDRRILDMVATASAVLQPDVPAPDAPAKPEFGGGRSGGAGASGGF
jgi:hypothetical protein